MNSSSTNQQPPKDNNQNKQLDKQPYQEPKLTFLNPKLVKQGSFVNLTKQGFFGTFPGPGS